MKTMGFLTGIDFKQCDWESTLCSYCAIKGYPKCGEVLKNTHEKISDAVGGDVLF